MQLLLDRCTIRDWRLDEAASLAKHANNRKVWLGIHTVWTMRSNFFSAQRVRS